MRQIGDGAALGSARDDEVAQFGGTHMLADDSGPDTGPNTGLDSWPDIWQQQDMRRALAARDLGTVFRLLQRHGISQRRIAALTGMSSSEVYEVLRGRRVMAYEVLCRVADGLGAARGYLGLAYDEETAELLELPAEGATSGSDDDRDGGRALLAYAAEVTVGTAGEPPVEVRSRRTGVSPLPRRLAVDDVVQVEAVTAGLRDLDYRFGGGSGCDLVPAHARRAERLCRLPAHPRLRRRLLVAVADVHNLAGWTAFDVGLYAVAHHHLARALDRARQAGAPSLIANVLYRAGRVHLHRGMLLEALRFFQLGQLAAQDSGSHRTVAMLCANIAWTYAEMGDEAQADVHLGRAADEFARGLEGPPPAGPGEPWAQFFGEVDMVALAGMTGLAVAVHRPARAASARACLERSVLARESGMARSLAFELGALATVGLLEHDREAGLRFGEQALAQALRLRSSRVLDRLRPLGRLAADCRDTGAGGRAVRDLGERIAAVAPAS
jgi:transcriptional regulator with XRE-family HTH domain